MQASKQGKKRKENGCRITEQRFSLSPCPCYDTKIHSYNNIQTHDNINNNDVINKCDCGLLCCELHGKVDRIVFKLLHNSNLVFEHQEKNIRYEKRIAWELRYYSIIDYENINNNSSTAQQSQRARVDNMKAEIKNMEQAERLMNTVKAGHIEALPDGRVFLIFDEEQDTAQEEQMRC